MKYILCSIHFSVWWFFQCNWKQANATKLVCYSYISKPGYLRGSSNLLGTCEGCQSLICLWFVWLQYWCVSVCHVKCGHIKTTFISGVFQIVSFILLMGEQWNLACSHWKPNRQEQACYTECTFRNLLIQCRPDEGCFISSVSGGIHLNVCDP